MTRGLVAGSLPADLSLRDLGEHRLKDLDQPERLFQLAVSGLPQEFPPPRTLETPTNLPAQATDFIGRKREVQDIADLAAALAPADPHRARRDRQDPARPAGRVAGARGVQRRRLLRRPLPAQRSRAHPHHDRLCAGRPRTARPTGPGVPEGASARSARAPGAGQLRTAPGGCRAGGPASRCGARPGRAGDQPRVAAPARGAGVSRSAPGPARCSEPLTARYPDPVRRGGAVHPTRTGRASGLRDRQPQRACGRRHLREGRRPAPGHRAGRCPGQVARPGGDPPPSGGQPVAPDEYLARSDRATADAPRSHRLEPRPARSNRTHPLPAARHLCGWLQHRTGAGDLRRGRPTWNRHARRAHVAHGQEPAATPERRRRRASRRHARDDLRVRAGAA